MSLPFKKTAPNYYYFFGLARLLKELFKRMNVTVNKTEQFFWLGTFL